MDKRQEIELNTYASHLRDVADKDYISARKIYHLGLMENFLWCSLQAVEKYLKAILLFNKKKADFGHKTFEIYEKIEKETDIHFGFNDEEENFLKRLEQGAERYYLDEKTSHPFDLLVLDKAVWKIRRFCQNLDIVVNGKSKRDLLVKELNKKASNDMPHKFKISGGYLENLINNLKTLSDLKRLQARALIYKNPQYGLRTKKVIKNYKNFYSASFPPYSSDPKRLDLLKGYVRGISKNSTK